MLSEVERKVLEYVDPDEVVRWTQELVRIPSVYRPERGETEEPAARWVRERLEEMGLTAHWEEAAPGRPNVIALLEGTEGDKTLMFEGHTDVVTEGDPKQWTHDPFGGEIADGRIYGRGACDMKGGLVAALCAMKAILESGVRLRGNILLGALADEEGLMLGVKHFVRQGWAEKVDAAVICEPEDNRLCIAQKGVMWIRLDVKGKMSHGCMPLQGINPIYPLGPILVALQEMEAAEIRKHGSHVFLGQPSITPTIIRSPVAGEPQNNVMPAESTLTLDIRLIPGQSPEEIEAQVRSLLERRKAAGERVTFSLEVLDSRPPTATSREEPLVQVMDAAYRDLTGKEPVYGGVPGSTDGTILYNWAGIPVVTCGPGNTFIPHQVDEYVEIDQLVEATRLYVLTALRYLGVAES